MTTDNPKITRLSAAIAEALAALVDLAKDGASEGLVPQADAPVATPPKRKPASAAGDPALKAALAKPASDAGIEDGTFGTGANTGSEESVSEPEVAEPEATRPVAQALSVDLAKAKGRDALVALLADHGVARCGELAEEQLADYCADARKRIAGD